MEKIYDLIAIKLGYTDIEQLILNEDSISELAKKAINLLCESYKVNKIFKQTNNGIKIRNRS